MCTVTWRRERDTYEVFFNRDERRNRAPARPPEVRASGPIRYVAPLDPQGGGTWLAANEHGVTAGLLNYYEREAVATPARPLSRGLLIPDLMAYASARELSAQASARADGRFAPFLLLAFAADGAWQVRWDGDRVESRALGDDDRPVSTSSFDTARVLERRRARWREAADGGDLSAEALERYHRSTDAEGGPYSVCMTRDDARTVSFSRVRVTPLAVVFVYEARGPDGAFAPGESVTLSRS